MTNLLAQCLGLLPSFNHKGGWFVPFDARRLVLEKLGRTARKHNATNFVRAKLNPKIHELVTMIETQRLERAFDRLLTAFDDLRPNPVIL